MNVVVIIPCYNEENRLPKAELLDYFSKVNPLAQLVLVNDGSSDQTAAVIEDCAAQLDRIHALQLQNNVGKGEAIRAGLKWADSQLTFDYAIYLDADLAAPLSTADLLLKRAAEHHSPAIVVGSRVKLHGSTRIVRSAWRHYVGRIIATMISEMLVLDIYDTQCGAKAVRRDMIGELCEEEFISRWFFDLELFLRYRSRYSDFEQQIIETPIQEWEEKGGSHLKFSDGLLTPFRLLKLRQHYSGAF